MECPVLPGLSSRIQKMPAAEPEHLLMGAKIVKKNREVAHRLKVFHGWFYKLALTDCETIFEVRAFL